MKTFKTPKGTELPILDLRGKDYLQVAWRLVWFREEHPDWSIVTEVFHDKDDKSCRAYAKILNSEGRVISTASKCEDVIGFTDYVEKAETGAIGRALAHCGYGTQFAPDLDEGERLADSPIERKPIAETNTAKLPPYQMLCPGCNKPMMISKFPNKMTGALDWYCSKCKKSIPRETVMNNPEAPEEDIQF